MSTNNPFRDRPYGEMGFGQNEGANPDWESGANKVTKLNEVAEGWKSNSFKLPLSSGGNPPSPADTFDGPAWPSKSKS